MRRQGSEIDASGGKGAPGASPGTSADPAGAASAKPQAAQAGPPAERHWLVLRGAGTDDERVESLLTALILQGLREGTLSGDVQVKPVRGGEFTPLSAHPDFGRFVQPAVANAPLSEAATRSAVKTPSAEMTASAEMSKSPTQPSLRAVRSKPAAKTAAPPAIVDVKHATAWPSSDQQCSSGNPDGGLRATDTAAAPKPANGADRSAKSPRRTQPAEAATPGAKAEPSAGGPAWEGQADSGPAPAGASQPAATGGQPVTEAALWELRIAGTDGKPALRRLPESKLIAAIAGRKLTPKTLARRAGEQSFAPLEDHAPFAELFWKQLADLDDSRSSTSDNAASSRRDDTESRTSTLNPAVDDPATAAPATRPARRRAKRPLPAKTSSRWHGPWRRRLIDALLVTGLLITLGGFNLYYYLNHYLEPAYVPPPRNERGFKSKVYVDQDGKEYKYAIFVPHMYDKEKYLWGLVERYKKPPVIMFLNGVGENGDDGIMQIKKWFGPDVWEMKRRFPFVVVAPQCAGDDGWAAARPSAIRAYAILRQVSSTLSILEPRICLTGLSSGGSGVLSIGLSSNSYFAALIPMCAGTLGPEPLRMAQLLNSSLHNTTTTCWLFYNRYDDEQITSLNEMLTRHCSLHPPTSFRCTAYPAKGHECWVHAYKTPHLYNWLLQ